MTGILGALNIGVSGLSAAGSGMNVVSDNIANAGTNGFKTSRAEFQDVLATSLNGIDGGDQFGAGTRLSHIKPVFTQGNIYRTESITDLAVNGNGFFAVEAPFGRGYTRDGSFHFDKEGYLINSDDYRVLGFGINSEGEIVNKVAPVQLGNTTIPAKSTDEVLVSMNIDSRESSKVFDINNVDETSSFSSTITVFDNIGTARLITLYFNKVENNIWEYHALVGAEDAAGAPTDVDFVEQATGRLVFNDKGLLQEEQEQVNSFNFNKGAAPNQKIKFNFGESIIEGGTGLLASTQYGSETAIARHSQDGYAAATLTSLSFSDEGILSAVFNNGETRNIAQMAIAKFENNEGLFKMGRNLFKESKKSGQAAMGKPSESGRGQIISKSLELSNVDLASEFVDLMAAQRNFNANSKTISVANEMLQEVLNIKR